MTYRPLLFLQLRLLVLMIACTTMGSSCYTYRVSTRAQAGTEMIHHKTVHSLFWGLLNKPEEIHTPLCDSLNLKGMAVVEVKTNFGYSLITVLTLGIWSPLQVGWKCSKPCQETGHL